MSGKNPHAVEAQGLGTAYQQQPYIPSPNNPQGGPVFPPGLLGEVAQFFLAAAPRPVPEIALSGAIGYLAGIAGNAYNVSGTGTNQYIAHLASTGTGKDSIASGRGRLNFYVHETATGKPFAHNGPGDLVSSAGLIKWLEDHPCNLTIIGEFTKKIREWTNARNPNGYALGRTILQVYSKSGEKETFDPLAYSDRERRTNIIFSPSLTIWGEGNPENFYEALDEGLIADGLLPRFLIFEYAGQRVRLNKHAKDALPSQSLVQRLKDLVASSATIRAQRSAIQVPLNPDAEALFDGFDAFTTDEINGSKAEVTRQLWNRAHLKALKLAALCAIGENPTHPGVTLAHATWAIKLVSDQTRHLIGRFAKGEVGEVAGNQIKQQNEVLRVIKQYLVSPYTNKYHGSEAMHAARVITLAHISKRLSATSAFMHDKQGATAAIHRTIKTLLESDILREVPHKQMVELFGTHPRAFCVSDPKVILQVDSP